MVIEFKMPAEMPANVFTSLVTARDELGLRGAHLDVSIVAGSCRVESDVQGVCEIVRDFVFDSLVI